MKQEHLSENELQQFVLDQQQADHELAAHVDTCTKCAAAIANYRAIFSALNALEIPVFNFDPGKLVLAQLPVSTTTKKSSFPWSLLLLSTIVVTILAITLFALNNFFINLFGNIPSLIFYLIITTALIIVILQCRELLVSYREKMRVLNFY